ncbi:FAD:protein FMN transferase [Rheinheimera sp. 4Y26]|uniref:FAD:protein FMN transferase n=1 Tax=Rheinheimera sp. 4Y26 TaxID=2977811 RepID=UPI0021B134EA|nr:FAD:protein FMN transferase [Rheinheimera sp. 4Y26]MCT6698171.1 FAD:protein FMN transferase [Rheinheimera sp. 4Y26]
MTLHTAPSNISLEATSYGWLGQFRAMASPCEILLEGVTEAKATELTQLAANETWRIEQKYSRYQPDSVLSQINQQVDCWQQLDDETAALMQFAKTCYQLSDGLFDITSGVLRKVWRFDGSDQIPDAAAVRALLPLVGFNQLKFTGDKLWLPKGMELDLGGIAKEYAVDKVAQLLTTATTAQNTAMVVNFGGDMLAVRSKADQQPWRIGIEHPGKPDEPAMLVALRAGALATSGDARRFLQKDGIRYSHILNPKTGWPVPNAPRSVTVSAPSCVMAGLLATTALLQGADAEAFLQQQGLQFWLIP